MKKQVKRKAMLLMIATLIIACFCATTITAFAAEYSAGYEGSGPVFANRTEQAVLTAVNDKVTEMNAAIDAVTALVDTTGMTEAQKATAYGDALSDAYNKGEIEGYSIHKSGDSLTEDGRISEVNRRSGYKMWEGVNVLDLKFMNAGYNGWGDNSVAWMGYDSVKNEVYYIGGVFAVAFENGGGPAQKIGQVASPRMTYFKDSQYYHYQNFTGGYFYSVGTNACTGVLKKNVTVDVEEKTATEIAAVGNITGLVGAVPKENTLISESVTATRIKNLFNDKYEELAAEGFNVGSPFSLIKTDSGKGTFYFQEFLQGDSVSTPWGDSRSNWSYLALNYDLLEVFLLKDEFMYIYENGGDLGDIRKSIGAPSSDVFVSDFEGSDARYQNFANGYMKATGTTPTNSNSNLTIVVGKNVVDGAEVTVDQTLKTGVIGGTVVLPQGVTKEQLSTMFKDSFDLVKSDYQSMVPTGYVGMAGNIISQTFDVVDSQEVNRSVSIMYDHANGCVRFLASAAFDAYTLNKALGYATTDLMVVASGGSSLPVLKVQGFQNGFIKIQSTRQVDENWNEYYVDKGVSTIGSTYNAEFGYFENTNYIDDVGKLSTVTSGDSVAPSNAYANLNVPQGEALTQAFKDAYQRTWDAGFSLGEPVDQGVVWWKTNKSGIVKLGFKGGNGTADLWGDTAMLVYDCDNSIVRMVTGGIANRYGESGASGNGWPITDMMIDPATGIIIQNFNLIDPDMTAGRKVTLIDNKGVTDKKEGEWFDFAANPQYIPYLDQYTVSTITLNSYTAPKTNYDLGETVTIDLRTIISNPQNYIIKFDTDVEFGTLTSEGVWTYSSAVSKSITINIDMYTAFEKVTFSTVVNVATGTVPETVDKAALIAKYNAVKDEDKSKYTEETYNAFKTALDAAKVIIDKENATTAEVTSALNALTTAHNNLAKKSNCKSFVAGVGSATFAGVVLLGAALLLIRRKKENA